MSPPAKTPAFGRGLFAGEYLSEGVRELDDYKEARTALTGGLDAELRSIREAFPSASNPSEQVTADELIWRVLGALGWDDFLREQNLSLRDRPDGLLFSDPATKQQALGVQEEPHRYQLGRCFVETKRWDLPLDQSGAQRVAPATQMLRYLRAARIVSGGSLRWGILSNGSRWRLYHTEARSISGEFFEVDLDAALGLDAGSPTLFTAPDEERLHQLTLFVLFFGHEGFLRTEGRPPVHEVALEEGRFFEERVAADLSDVIFGKVFPSLVASLAEAAPNAALSEVRDGALVLLYRLLFILYAEDRGLLPIGDTRYQRVSLRDRVRNDIATRKDRGDAFSEKATGYWHALTDLTTMIDEGDSAVGLPPYNGGLFDASRSPLLGRVTLSNRTMADLLDWLGSRDAREGRRYISYRDLSVQQLGSVYERLLEQEVVEDSGRAVVRPNASARRDSGSYYTPEVLVRLIIEETVGPRIEEALAAFRKCAHKESDPASERLREADAAQRILDLRVCDPAMGSGHFLVSLVDYLTDRVIEALADAHEAAPDYESPVATRIAEIRKTILENAKKGGWAVEPSQLDDRHLVRRMVLKRSVFGVDQNPMAVELAKVSLWLHSFTVGAPLGFLDHHLRCGDSLFGSWVQEGTDRAIRQGGSLFVAGPLREAAKAARPMEAIERLTDVEPSEVAESERLFEETQKTTEPLIRFLSLLDAFDWLTDRKTGEHGTREARAAVTAYLAGTFGDPVGIAAGSVEPTDGGESSVTFADLLGKARSLAEEQRFLHWSLAFPGVWGKADGERQDGFDAVIGNPPWDRVKLQQVEWFAFRRPEIATAQTAAERKKRIKSLRAEGDPLAADFEKADRRARATAEAARRSDDYPLLSKGDINLYSLFVERALSLLNPEGAIGLLVPSGIASDKTAAPFFRSVATKGRLRALYDFENRRTRWKAPPFFPAVDSRFKFCVFVVSRSPQPSPSKCGFFLQAVSETRDGERLLLLTPDDFRRVNPNTGTAPIFRNRRDQEITTGIYERLPVLVDRSSGEAVAAWPVRHHRQFDLTNDSGLFRTLDQLQNDEGAWRVAGNRFDSASGGFVPLYEGKMVQAFDHRAASVVVNPANVHRPGVAKAASDDQHGDPGWLPEPQFWIGGSEIPVEHGTVIAFKRITATTNIRTVIAGLLPRAGVGNTLPILLLDQNQDAGEAALLQALIVANLNAAVLDFAARQKVQALDLNWFIVEQLPVVPLAMYETAHFGAKSAGDIVRDAVLELTYTAHDMEPFAAALGHKDATGNVLPPFVWDDERRLRLRAKLDAVFFHLYGVTDTDDIRYIYSTFPILEREEKAKFGSYRSRDLCLAWMNALAAGKPDSEPV